MKTDLQQRNPSFHRCTEAHTSRNSVWTSPERTEQHGTWEWVRYS